MAKDPAVLFYTSDFMSGCLDLDMNERGQYITLLCAQHQKGPLSEKTIRLLVGSVSVSVLSKFKVDENGNYYNERMKLEAYKRSQFVDSRHNNGSKGGRPKKHKDNLMVLHMDNHMENENENESLGKGKEGVEEKPSGYFEKFINDSLWLENVERAIGAKPVPWVQKFNDHVLATQEFHPVAQKWKQHCVSWIKKEMERKPKQIDPYQRETSPPRKVYRG